MGAHGRLMHPSEVARPFQTTYASISRLGVNVRTAPPVSASQASEDHIFAVPCWMNSSCALAPTSRVHVRLEMFLIFSVILSGAPCFTVGDSGTGTTDISSSVHGPVAADGTRVGDGVAAGSVAVGLGDAPVAAPRPVLAAFERLAPLHE